MLLLFAVQGVFAANERLLAAVRLFEGEIQGAGEQPAWARTLYGAGLLLVWGLLGLSNGPYFILTFS